MNLRSLGSLLGGHPLLSLLPARCAADSLKERMNLFGIIAWWWREHNIRRMSPTLPHSPPLTSSAIERHNKERHQLHQASRGVLSRSINTCSDHHYLFFKSSRSTPSGTNLTRTWVVMVILIVFMLWASVAIITYWFDNSDDAKKPIETSTPRVVAGDVPYPPIQIV